MTIVPSTVLLYPENTTVIEMDGLQDEVSGAYILDATVTATLIDCNGTPDPILKDIVLAFITASNGNYQGVVPNTFNAALGSGYTLQVKAVTSGIQAFWSFPAQVLLRTQ